MFFHHSLPQDAERYVARGLSVAPSEWIAASIRGGGFGVDLFLTLSAYLITDLLLRERERTGTLSVKRFYIRRALRIWPLYYAFLAFAVLGAGFFVPGQGLGVGHLVPFAFFVGNWDLALHGYTGSIADPLWSVSIEEQFYLVWPLILAFGARRLRTTCVLLLVIATATRLAVVLTGAPHPAIWCNTFARVDPIALGALLATLRLERLTWSTGKRVVAIASSGALFAVAGRLDGFHGLRSLVTYPIVAVACLVMLLAFLDARFFPPSVGRVLAYLGRISYGLYVFHLFAIMLVRRAHLPILPAFLLALIATTLLAAISFELLERPFLRLKERFTVIHSRPV